MLSHLLGAHIPPGSEPGSTKNDFADAQQHYLDAWGRVMRASLDAGGTIAHHHGIGRLRADWLREELGTAYPLLLALMRALDPAGLMNPGTLVARQ